jgi:hypothetical protein
MVKNGDKKLSRCGTANFVSIDIVRAAVGGLLLLPEDEATQHHVPNRLVAPKIPSDTRNESDK